MIINEYVLMELNQQRRAQVADNIAALRETRDRHGARVSLFHRRPTTARPVTTAIAFGTGSTAK